MTLRQRLTTQYDIPEWPKDVELDVNATKHIRIPVKDVIEGFNSRIQAREFKDSELALYDLTQDENGFVSPRIGSQSLFGLTKVWLVWDVIDQNDPDLVYRVMQGYVTVNPRGTGLTIQPTTVDLEMIETVVAQFEARVGDFDQAIADAQAVADQAQQVADSYIPQLNALQGFIENQSFLSSRYTNLRIDTLDGNLSYTYDSMTLLPIAGQSTDLFTDFNGDFADADVIDIGATSINGWNDVYVMRLETGVIALGFRSDGQEPNFPSNATHFAQSGIYQTFTGMVFIDDTCYLQSPALRLATIPQQSGSAGSGFASVSIHSSTKEIELNINVFTFNTADGELQSLESLEVSGVDYAFLKTLPIISGNLSLVSMQHTVRYAGEGVVVTPTFTATQNQARTNLFFNRFKIQVSPIPQDILLSTGVIGQAGSTGGGTTVTAPSNDAIPSVQTESDLPNPPIATSPRQYYVIDEARLWSKVEIDGGLEYVQSNPEI